jgi:hypothetical protein
VREDSPIFTSDFRLCARIFTSGFSLVSPDARENTPCCRADARFSAAVCAYAPQMCGKINPPAKSLPFASRPRVKFGIRKNDAALSPRKIFGAKGQQSIDDFCEGVSPKKSLIKIGEPSHTSTRFFATRFFQMPARGRGGKSEGAKKHHAFSRRSFFRMPSADVVGIWK